MRVLDKVLRTNPVWWMMMMMVVDVSSLSGPHVCVVQQKYNVTKRVKYRAPMTMRTYEWCFAMPPRCSKWSTEMKDLTRLETEERTADTAICCPGYKMRDITCIPICPDGKTGFGCLEDCPPNKWGPNCVNDCKACIQGTCSAVTGECQCHTGWQGESCNVSLPTTPGAMMESLTTAKASTITKTTTIPTLLSSNSDIVSTTTTTNSTFISIQISTTGRPKSSSTKGTTSKSSFAIKLESLATEATKTQDIVNIKYVPSTVPKQNVYYNESLTTYITKEQSPFTTESTIQKGSIYNRTETSFEYTPSVFNFITPLANDTAKTTKSTVSSQATDNMTNERVPIRINPLWTTEPTKASTEFTTNKEIIKSESRRTETTVKPQTTAKFKPKEIWIRPAQKGEHYFDTKAKLNIETKSKMKEESTEITTPKTIVVSIIPTSVSYASFKRIFLTTASYLIQKRANLSENIVTTNTEHTKAMTISTVQPTTQLPLMSKIRPRNANSISFTNSEPTKTEAVSTRTFPLNETKATTSSIITNSMAINTTKKLSPTHSLTTISSTNLHKPKTSQNPVRNFTILSQITTRSTSKITVTQSQIMAQNPSTEHYPITKQLATVRKNASVNPLTNKYEQTGTTKVFLKKLIESNSKRNITHSQFDDNIETTKNPMKYEETFPILTEPEHITAVMGEKANERSSVDLISVISIAGGVMMGIITVAVIIVMIERCKKPRYEDNRKYNEIRMQVMADDNNINDSPPPPYVRSIFHTPLPDPPTLEKCHYQPISTLDRNLKQFMRPVVVQTISPLMLENFRGILECHYDHLPRRSHDCDSMQMRCSVTPSIDERSELLPKRVHSLTDSTIETMKCEATFDVIDSTTSEPLYAEIPCWRPPSEHAVEVVNMHGEAVTEL